MKPIALSIAALSVLTLNGCTSAFHQGHVYADTYRQDRTLETTVQTRNDKKKEWNDDARQDSAKRLAHYWLP